MRLARAKRWFCFGERGEGQTVRPEERAPASVSKGGWVGGQRSGFTLLEVVVALGILAIGLVAIFQMQGGNVDAAHRSRDLTVAALLAQSKMIDIERELFKEGFSDFAESMDGDFSEEGWPDYKWSAQLTKVEIPIPDSYPGSENNPQASLIMSASSFITDLIKNSLRECVLTVYWDEGGPGKEMEVSTHFIDVTKAMFLDAPSSGAASSSAAKSTGSTSLGATSTSTSTKSVK